MKRILFFGDSITDMGRYRELNSPFSLGNSYVYMVAERLLTISRDYEIINRGISGNKVTDLLDRINEDVVSLKPDVVSILIGVNDVWHALNGHGTKLKQFSETYQEIIDIIQKKLPKTRIYILEPFILHGSVTDVNFEHFEKVYKYARKVRQIAHKNNLVFIPLQKQMVKLGEKIGDKYVLYDGVHPDVLGNKLLCDRWMGVFKKYEIK